MTEQEWLGAVNPHPMVKFLWLADRRRPGRKLRLFACGCCRRAWHLFADPQARRAVEAAERFADGTASEADRAAAEAAVAALFPEGFLPEPGAVHWNARLAALRAVEVYDDGIDPTHAHGAGFAPCKAARAEEVAGGRPAAGAAAKAAQAALLRCIFGNPFRPAAFAPGWRSSAAVALAEAIYAGRAWDRLPVLADALEDAGCDNADVLAHCRAGGDHARGCWVVDLILGKA